MKKKTIIIVIIVCFLILLGLFIYRDQTRCYEIQRRCIMYDLSTIENVEDIDLYRSLNDKCAGKCWTAKLKLDFDKRLCRFRYKQYKERTKNRRYFKADTYNPCPELYTLAELNYYLYN